MYVGPDIVDDGLVFAVDAGSTRSYSGSGTSVNSIVSTNTATLYNGVAYSSNNYISNTWYYSLYIITMI